MKKLLLLAAAAVSLCANADYFVVGSNVNGSSWTNGAEDAKMTPKGDGLYEWNGEILGSGFKITNGTWDGPTNYGSDGTAKLVLGQEFWMYADGGSQNIDFDGFTEVINPKVVFNETEGTVVVTGEAKGKFKWYITGDFNAYNMAQYELAPTDAENIFKATNVEFTEEFVSGKFQLTQDGWSNKYGADNDETIMITPEQLSVVLIPITTTEGGECPYTLPAAGKYDVTWDYENTTVTFTAAGSAVETIDADNNAPAVYYNLQGVRVNNPKNGIFVKVAGNKAVKVNIAK